MGSGDWLKSIVRSKKSKLKGSDSQKINGIKTKNLKISKCKSTGSSINVEELAAIRIQSAFRKYKARKTFRSLRGIKRLNMVMQSHPAKQASVALDYIQSWNRIQTEIRSRRAYMVTEARNKQKKQDNQQKLEAKLHDIEVDWCGGSDSREVILGRIQQREEAAVKRERLLAYAFSHQWRARPGINLGPFNYETGKNGWGWSWTDRWIAARPWELRVPFNSTNSNSTNPKKKQPKISSQVGSNTTPAIPRASSSNDTSARDGKESKTKPPPQKFEGKKEQKDPKTKDGRPMKLKSKSAKANKE